MKKFAVIESMTKFTDPLSGRVVRVWRAEERFQEEYVDTHCLIGTVLGSMPSEWWSTAKIIEALTSVPGVSAVEVVDRTGCGVVVYPDWP